MGEAKNLSPVYSSDHYFLMDVRQYRVVGNYWRLRYYCKQLYCAVISLWPPRHSRAALLCVDFVGVAEVFDE
jgi:hypothetical protein